MHHIVIWTPINSESGFGHFYRMLGLYEKLASQKYHISYFTNDNYYKLCNVNILQKKTNQINLIVEFLKTKLVKLVIIDNYKVNESDLLELKKNFKVVYFDAKFINPNVDAILNFNPFAINKYKNRNPQTKYFLGLKYMIFRNELKSVKKVRENKDNVFISIGGSDIEQITYKLLPFLSEKMKYTIVIGQGCSSQYLDMIKQRLESLSLTYNLYQQPENYFEILQKSEFAIVSCSTSTYEIIFFSKAFICINIVENQNILSEYLAKQDIQIVKKDKLYEVTNIINEKKFKKLEITELIGEYYKDLLTYLNGLINDK